MTLSTNDLDAIRSEAETFYPDDVSIVRNTPVPDGAGGQTDTWATVATVSGRLEPPTGREMLLAERQGLRADAVLKIPVGTDVTEQDRAGFDGVVFEVVHVHRRSYATQLVVDLRLL